MATFDYPDFTREIPETRDLRISRLKDGYAEQRFREAIQDIITECGNRLIARGLAEEIVREETERLR